MENQRRQFRFPVQRRGFITRGKQTTLCEVQDITESGLRFTTDLSLGLSETVALEMQLDGNCVIHCRVLITHAQPPQFGGRIVDMLPEDHRQLAGYIERLIKTSMTGQ